MLVSVCMIVRNEETYIVRAIESTKGLADEVVVVDTGSTDRTVDLAKSCGARLFQIAWDNDFAKARNASLRQARGEWIVVLDADEFFEPEEAARLRTFLEGAPDPVSGFNLTLCNLIEEAEPHRFRDLCRVIRAFRNRASHRYQYPIHEQIVDTLVDGTVEDLPVRFLHSGYIRSVESDRNKAQRNRELLEEHVSGIVGDKMRLHYVQMQLGNEYARVGAFEKAVESYSAAFGALDYILSVPINVGFAVALVMGLCHSLLQLRRVEDTVRVADRAIAAGLQNHGVWFYRGWARVEQGALDEGIRDLLWSIALAKAGDESFMSNENALNAWTMAIDALIRRGAVPVAAALLVRALEANPEEGRFLALATAVCELDPDLRTFIVTRGPQAAMAGLERQARAEGRFRTAVAAFPRAHETSLDGQEAHRDAAV